MILFAIEYETDFNSTTYEIFDTLKEAKKFADDCDVPLYIFKADFSKNSIYREKDGHWNYDDGAGVFKNSKIVKCYICNHKQ